MRIVIDMQGAQSSGSWNRGIGRYTMALTRALVSHCKDHEINLVLNGSFPESIERIRETFKGILPDQSIHIWYPLTPANMLSVENTVRRQTSECLLQAFLASLLPDVVLVSSLFEGLVDDAITSLGDVQGDFMTAVILYDLIPLVHQDLYLENPLVKDWYLQKINHLKSAHLCLAISESSRNEGVEHLGFSAQRCVNISADADPFFQRLKKNPEEWTLTKKKYGIEQGFIMYTGGIDFRKNIEVLIRAYSQLPEALRQIHQLAIVCSVQDTARHQLQELAKQHGLSPNELILTGFVPEEDLVSLYNYCSLFVFTSWHEGFGLPALEAMRCGAPVISSNLSSLPEVVGMEEAMFDPHSFEAIAGLIQRSLIDEGFRKRLIENAKQQSAKFSWDDSAMRAILAMEQAHAENINNRLKNPKKITKPKLAYVSPLPPERSGISDYSAELLPALAEHYEIEVVVQQDHISDPWIQANCPIRTVEWFMVNSRYYDRVIYHFGNSSFHKHMFAMLQSVPGIVVLHDFYLSGVAHHMQATGYAPNFFNQALYHSHGYNALQNIAKAKDISEIIFEYPASRVVLENSVGTIVHSENSVRLAKKYYNFNEASIQVIPLMREPALEVERGVARQSLGFEKNDFVVCTFGLLGPTKLNNRLLKAWLASELAQDKTCHLVFVGQNQAGEYGDELMSSINRSSCATRIHITGWASSETFKTYLEAANIGVQLRTLSRGETSAAVLDCMNYGLPTIVNANGSMADLDESAVWMLPEEFNDKDLTLALETLWRNDAMRKILAENAKQLILDKHNPDLCAQSYAEAIESFYKKKSPLLIDLYPKISAVMDGIIDDGDLLKLAKNLALNFPLKNRARQLLVDVSELVERDAKTGIQRVVKNILKEWLDNPPIGYRVEPVYASNDQGYRYARCFSADFMNIPQMGLIDECIEYSAGDIFFALDFSPQLQVRQSNFYRHLREQRVIVKFLVYDLLPIQIPQYFESDVAKWHTDWLQTLADADGAICISNAVANDLKEWLVKYNPHRLNSFQIEWFHLGSDIKNSQTSQELPKKVQEVLSKLAARSSFLMVGTLEPRKGHIQVLDAFELLWKEGFDVNLVFVGKQGWMLDLLVKRLSKHSELNKRLFWLEDIDDEYLEKIYKASTCLIAASLGEGFGLPLIEAAQHKLPIIARDIPVFREVAGKHAHYFRGTVPQTLADSVKNWLLLYSANNAPQSGNMPWFNWEQSAQQLKNLLNFNFST